MYINLSLSIISFSVNAQASLSLITGIKMKADLGTIIFDFKAKLVFKTSKEEGRNTPSFSGYRPHIEFEKYPEYLRSGSLTYLNKDKIFPGDTEDGKIKTLETEYCSRRLYVDKVFRFCERKRTIGT